MEKMYAEVQAQYLESMLLDHMDHMWEVAFYRG